ncbi:MAG: hypothetical protein VX074_03830 [Bacteroidota bacterium]|nr:hypothetical protein [Bacteroidota bacterium]
MEIIKESNVIPYSSEKLYSHIIDIDNYEQILKDEIRSFDKLSENEFKIKIGNMPGINLLLNEFPENNEVKLSSNDSNLNFYILIKIDAIESNSSKIKVQFVGNFSSMIEMMIKKPLNAFIDSLKNKIENISF